MITKNIQNNDVITGVTIVPNSQGIRPLLVFSAGRHTGGTCFYLKPTGKTDFEDAVPITTGLYSGAYSYGSFVLFSGDDGSSGITNSAVYDFSSLPPKKIELPNPTTTFIPRGGYIGPVLTNGPDVVLVGKNETEAEARIYTLSGGKYDNPISVSVPGTYMGVSVAPLGNGKVFMGTRIPWRNIAYVNEPKINSPNVIVDFKGKTFTTIPSSNQTVNVSVANNGEIILTNGGETNIAPEQSYSLNLKTMTKTPIGDSTWLTRKIVPFGSSLFVVSLFPQWSPGSTPSPHPHSIVKNGVDYPIPKNLLPSFYNTSEARGIAIGNLWE